MWARPFLTIKLAVLALVASVVGFFGFAILEHRSPVALLHDLATHGTDCGNTASACTPHGTQSDIFFVSCGGIY